MADRAEAFRVLTLLVAVLEQASACLGDADPPRHDALIERIDGLRNVVAAELATGRFAHGGPAEIQ